MDICRRFWHGAWQASSHTPPPLNKGQLSNSPQRTINTTVLYRAGEYVPVRMLRTFHGGATTTVSILQAVRDTVPCNGTRGGHYSSSINRPNGCKYQISARAADPPKCQWHDQKHWRAYTSNHRRFFVCFGIAGCTFHLKYNYRHTPVYNVLQSMSTIIRTRRQQCARTTCFNGARKCTDFLDSSVNTQQPEIRSRKLHRISAWGSRRNQIPRDRRRGRGNLGDGRGAFTSPTVKNVCFDAITQRSAQVGDDIYCGCPKLDDSKICTRQGKFFFFT